MKTGVGQGKGRIGLQIFLGLVIRGDGQGSFQNSQGIRCGTAILRIVDGSSDGIVAYDGRAGHSGSSCIGVGNVNPDREGGPS